MRGTLIVGITLLIIGAAILGYGHFSYKTREQVLEFGPLKATVEHTKTVPLPPIIGWALIGSGACVLLFGIKNRTS
jgi:hypothetical protein